MLEIGANYISEELENSQAFLERTKIIIMVMLFQAFSQIHILSMFVGIKFNHID